MGCWSESCALSGLEIKYGDECYIAILSKDGDSCYGHVFELPPIKGLYDDYGGVEKLEASALWKIEAGSHLDRDEIYKYGSPIYIAASIFDRVGEIVPEWDYEYKTLEEAIENQRKSLKAAAEAVRAASKASAGVRDDPVKKAKYSTLLMTSWTMLSDSFRGNVPLRKSRTHLENIAESGGNTDEFIEQYLRVVLLKMAEYELRHRLVSGVSGPQHNGEKALVQFSKIRIEVVEAAAFNRRLENGEVCRTCHKDIHVDQEWLEGQCSACAAKSET